MPGSASPNDYEVVSNDILDGNRSIEDLPEAARQQLLQYWQTKTAPDASGQIDMQALQEQRQKQLDSVGGTPFFLKPIEAIGSGLYWLYSKTVSPAISTLALGAHRAIYGKESIDQFANDPWGVQDAKDLWSDAHKVSPGQAIWMLGLNNKELRDRGISPNQMAADKDLILKGKYRDTPTKNDPFGSIPAYQEYFGKGAAKFVTGSTDFAVSWWADPMVIGLKGAGGLKAGLTTKPITEQVEAAGKAAGSANAFERLTQESGFQKMVDTIADIKKNNPDNAALVMRQHFPTFSKSANGDVMARLMDQARSKDEISDLLRVAMGDAGGYMTLQSRNTLLDYQVKNLTAKQVLHQTYFDSLSPAKQSSVFGQRVQAAIQQQEKAIARMDGERSVISDKLNAFKALDNMNFNEIITPAALKVRQTEMAAGATPFKAVAGKGLVKGAGSVVYNAAVGAPIKLVRTYNDIKPSYFIDIHAEDSYKEVNAALAEHKTLPRDVREKMVSDYVKATPNERQRVLVSIENNMVRRMVDEYNAKVPAGGVQLDRALADDLYQDFLTRRRGGQAGAAKRQSYGAGKMVDPNGSGNMVRIAEIEADGGRMVPTPIFDTQLANNHVIMDFRTMQRAINAHGEKFQKLKDLHGRGWHELDAVADTIGTTWKFAQLFRVGYIARALSDDFLGQLARFGGMAMATRAAGGSKTFVTDLVRGKFMKDSVDTARGAMDMLDTQISDLARVQENLKSEIALVSAGRKPGDVKALTDDLNSITDDILDFRNTHADMSEIAARGSQMRDVRIGRQVFSGAFAGKQGELFADLAAGERNFANMMGNSSDWYLKRMRRQNWENISVTTKGEDFHLDAWHRVVNDQIGQSAIGRQALMGKSEGELVNWMRSTPEGRAYRKEIGLKNIQDLELASRVKAYVDDIMPTAFPGMDAARMYAAEGKLTKDMLSFVPAKHRPDVNAEMFSYAEGRNPVAQLLDRSISGWYKFANQLPATHLLRHPLFGQQYKANLADAVKRLKAQGVTRIDEGMRKTLEESARRSALKDVKEYTFTMDHETKMAYGLRHMGAFFGAQQESWNRWARIISDKPETLGRVSQVYGAPARAGLVVDQDGNPVDAAGNVTDPVSGETRLTKYGERKILVQIPEYLGGEKVNKALGLDKDAKFSVPMSSLEIIMNHGDGYLPVGAGPYVQIAANHFATEDPDFADVAKKFGVLPFGPQDSVWNFVNPTTGKRLGDSMDDFSETKQRSLFYAMQVEHHKYETGLRSTEPTWDELMDRADRWAWFRTSAAFLMPFSINQQDPYQFFRDEYSRMQKLDQNSADEKFYEKYGDSFYSFSQSMSKNNTGLKPTTESVKMSAYYQDLIDKVGPEYAGLIVGDEGDGEFSQGAYFYQKTHGIGAGSTSNQREQLDAREAWKKGMVARGWQQYNSIMDTVNAKLFDAGFSSYDEKGAETFKNMKKAILYLLTKREMPDGTKNGFYNEAWEEEWNSFDKGKYDRNAANLYKIVEDPMIWSKAVNPDGTVGVRSDIYTLRTYLEYRREMQKTLIERKMAGGSDDITTKKNRDLKDSWDRMTLSLLEADTRFGWVHSRYFGSDMGFNQDTAEDQFGSIKPLSGGKNGAL